MKSSDESAAELLAKNIEHQLSKMMTEDGVNIVMLRNKAAQLHQLVDIADTRLDQQEVFTNDGMPVMRIEVMNGLPYPLATAWVELPQDWFDQLGRLQ